MSKIALDANSIRPEPIIKKSPTAVSMESLRECELRTALGIGLVG